MVEFKVVVNDTKKGNSHQVQVSGHHANSLIGKKIGDEVDGIFISLPGYKLQITGGTDKDGFSMRSDLPGMVRRKLLVSDGMCFNAKEKGLRRKKSVRGNTVGQDIVQINMKVVKHGSRSIDQLVKPKQKTEEKGGEKIQEDVDKKSDGAETHKETAEKKDEEQK
ncbi:MAG TPA: 30S ribosomal protein S6e [Bacteroidetes bacterium]|nr:30S ribosomal protein S6e [Bacteroidota bacterium]